MINIKKSVAFFALVIVGTIVCDAQNLIAYHVVGNVTYKVGGKSFPLVMNTNVTEQTVINIPYNGKVELIDESRQQRITLDRPGNGSIHALAEGQSNSISKLSNQYITYVKKQLTNKGLVSQQRYTDMATVTRSMDSVPNGTNVHDDATASNSIVAQFNMYKKASRDKFESFRDKCNREYAEFVRQAWTKVGSSPRVERPVVPEVKPVIYNGTDRFLFFCKRKHKAKKVETDSGASEKKAKQPQPIEEIKEVAIPDSVKEFAYMPFTFFGTEMRVRIDETKRLNIGEITPNRIADILLVLSTKDYDNLLYDCLELRKEHQFCDWAYLLMLKEVCDQFCGKGTNEAALMLGYLYYQSGYKVRFASDDVRLYLLVASKHLIYDKSAYLLDDEFFYPVEEISEPIYICKAEFPKEQDLSLYIYNPQIFSTQSYDEREIQSTRYPEICFKVKVGKELIDFYNTYPTSYVGEDFTTRWAMYANTPMDESVKEQVYPVLLKELQGLSELDAVNRLLNLVQTGLEYEYDDKVWGYDRAFFAEESLYYPYCDCEDRSILFTRLVRDLLGLECVLVYYPGHLASAVHFTSLSEPHGDYFTYNDKDFIVCDPTFINAGVGMQMSSMKDEETILIPIK